MKKHGLFKKKLLLEILLLVLLPVTLLIVFAGLSIQTVGNNVSRNLVKHELNTSLVAMEAVLDGLSEGDYQFTKEGLKKGSSDISGNQEEILDSFYNSTGVDITLFVNGERIATSIKDTDGNRILHTMIDASVRERAEKGEQVFVEDIVIAGRDYYGFYSDFGKTAEGDEMIFFSGMESTSTKKIFTTGVVSNTIFMTVMGILFCIIATFCALAIIKVIKQAVSNLEAVSDGDLTISVDEKALKRKDEIGEIAVAVNALLKTLREIMGNVQTSSKEMDKTVENFKKNYQMISDSTKNINIAVEEIAKGATE